LEVGARRMSEEFKALGWDPDEIKARLERAWRGKDGVLACFFLAACAPSGADKRLERDEFIARLGADKRLERDEFIARLERNWNA